MKRDILERLQERRAKGEPIVLATDIDSGRQAVLAVNDSVFEGIDLVDAVRAALRSDRPAMIESRTGGIFLNPFNPPKRMVLIGAVHIAQALAPMAEALDYRVTIVDPRGAFAEKARFEGLRLVEDWPDSFLAAERPDQRTAVVTLTHDPKLDDAALIEALGTQAFYIGSLGSRKTHNARIERLSALGVDPAQLTRIHAPVGLRIGARTPAEIAIAILAEITARLRGADAIRPDSA